MDRFLIMDIILNTFMVIVAVIVIAFFACLPSAIKNDARIFNECLKDHKEYECRAMLRSGRNSTFVPIIIGR